jgi:hypothetical protein
MQSTSRRLIIALAIAVPVLVIGALVWQDANDAVVPEAMPTAEDAGAVLAAPTSSEGSVASATTQDESNENALRPIGPKASERLPAACGSCAG